VRGVWGKINWRSLAPGMSQMVVLLKLHLLKEMRNHRMYLQMGLPRGLLSSPPRGKENTV